MKKFGALMTVRQLVFVLFLVAGFTAPAMAAGPMPISAVASVSEMQALDGARYPVVQVLSYYAGNGRGGGLFTWNAASAATPDDCVTFQPQKQAEGQKGRWIRQFSGALDATMCGVWWDSSHDDAAALSHAFAAAAALRVTLSLPGGEGKICATVKTAEAVIVRGQGMSAATGSSPTVVDAGCMKTGFVFEITTPKGTNALEAPKYYDMEIVAPNNDSPGGCIRWNRPDGGFEDSANTQYYIMHPHAERIYCVMQGSRQTGIECSKCFDGDFSQNNIAFGKFGIVLEGSDVMCIGCAGPNRIANSSDNLIRMVSHGTFGNMDRVVGNEILYPKDNHQPYDAFIYDATRSSTIEGNHIEGIVSGLQSIIHVVGGFSHAIENNDVAGVVAVRRVVGVKPVPHWLVAEGPFVNFRATNNGCEGCILGPALFTNHSPDSGRGGVRQTITHGGNSSNGDLGFPFNSTP